MAKVTSPVVLDDTAKAANEYLLAIKEAILQSKSGSNIPSPPSRDGDFILVLKVKNGIPTYEWQEFLTNVTYYG